MNKSDNPQWDIVIESPGRINIIGEHIDYNDGFVLPTAIDKKITFRIRKNGENDKCFFRSKDFNTDFTFYLSDVKVSDKSWENYILGVVYEIQQLTDKLQGFDCEITSTIPVGSGVSSSAALECGLAFALNELFSLGIDKLEIVKLSQRAEHNFVGTKCGIMDQFASVMSKSGNVVLLDCQTLDYEHIPINIEPYTFLLLNTNVSHDLATGEYNTRRQQCEEGLDIIQRQFPEIKSFRDVNNDILKESKGNMSAVVYNRCKHVIDETQRVHKAVDALKNNKMNALGEYLYESHEGLSKLYEVSCKELDFLVDFTKSCNEVTGARMMGGGFGGCTINLIKTSDIPAFTNKVSTAYFNKFGIQLTAFEANPGNGTVRL